MKLRDRAAVYPVAFILVVVGLVLAGAMALSLLITGDPAYPVHVFGNARTADRISGVTTIRPSDHPALPQGHIDPRQLLPLPPPQPAWSISAGDLAEADPTYRALALLGAAADLDRARVAAQNGRRTEAMRLYAVLGRRFPGMKSLLFEHASVLASFGEHARATTLLQSQLARYEGDFGLRMLAAQNAWWSQQPLLADTLLGQALALQPADSVALGLRRTIRESASPPLALALAWVRGGGAREQLVLARAYVRDGQYGAALSPYRAAAADAAMRTDSLLLEAASAAIAADSVAALAAFTEEYLAIHPGESEPLLRLARAYSWRGDYADALRNYTRAGIRDDSVRFEVAQVMMWSGNESAAERELRAVVANQPANSEALKLLGDLAAWRAEWGNAATYYARAEQISPATPGLHAALVSARQGIERERLTLAQARAIPEAQGVEFNGYADNQRFRWATTRASRSFVARNVSLTATAGHNVLESAPGGALSRNPGLTGSVEGALALGRMRLAASGGAERYASFRTVPTYGASVTIDDVLGGQFGAEWRHETAALALGSLAALQAETMSDAFTLTGSGTRGAWSLWTQGEASWFRSLVGDSRRVSGAASLSRQLTPRLGASVAVSALAFDRPAPTLPGWGDLYWAPERFIEPSAGVTYSSSLARDLTLTTGVTAGYGFARERGTDRRFGSGMMPTGGLAATLAFDRGRWHLDAGTTYGGALQRGYRAATVRAAGAYRLGR